MKEFPHEAGHEAVRASPPLAVGAATLAGISLQDWVFIATLIYLALQIGYLAFKFWRDWKRRDEELEDEE